MPAEDVMTKDGYTLVEMAVALATIGLLITGLLQSIHVIGRFEARNNRAIADARRDGDLQDGLARSLSAAGPFLSSDAAAFAGSPSGFSYPCQAGICGAKLTEAGERWRLGVSEGTGAEIDYVLPGALRPQFTYVGEHTAGKDWPQTLPPQRLVLITLTEGDEASARPLASVRLWADEPKTCSFDVIAQVCRP